MKVSELVDLTKVIPELKGRVYHTWPQKNPPFPCVLIASIGRNSPLQYQGEEITVVQTFSVDVYAKKPSELEKLVESLNALYTRNDITNMGMFDAFDNKEGTYRTNLTYRVNSTKHGTYRGG